MRLLRRRKKQVPELRWPPIPTFHGITDEGIGYVHEVCAFCFGGGCDLCEKRGYIVTPYGTAEDTDEALRLHGLRGTVAVAADGPPDWMGHEPKSPERTL